MRKKTKVYELIIIGGGPAGVAAAVYAESALSSVLLIERKTVGGKVNEISLVNNYIGIPQIRGKQLSLMMKKQLLAIGLSARKLEVTSVQKRDNFFIIKGQDNDLYSRSVIIATGSSWRELKLEKTKNIHYKNFSYRATSDAYLTRGKAVLVVGGGYSGCQTADFLSSFAERIYLIHKGKQLTVDSGLKSRILGNRKIEVYLDSTPLKTGGEKKLESCIISVDDNFQKKLEVEMIFPCIGATPNSGLIREIANCTETGSVRVNSDFQTSNEGLFAAGDVIPKNNSQIITAVAEGVQTAQAAIKYLLGKV